MSQAGFNTRSLGEAADGDTPLEDEDLDGLIPTYITTRAELNRVEAEGISGALPWAVSRARSVGPEGLLTNRFLFDLHRALFREVWKWAGTARLRETSIGIDPAHIPEQVSLAMDDARYWHDNSTYLPDELAIRIHHRLVSVHPFRNGNGRTTRLMADLYLESAGGEAFSWAGARQGEPGEIRRDYLAAVRSADAGDFSALIAFARS